jgi:hypothetical protein
MVGRIFDVELSTDKSGYSVIDWKKYTISADEWNGTCGLYISVEDTIKLDENKTENMETQNLLLEMCNFSLFERTANEYVNRLQEYPSLLRELKQLKQKNMLLLERLHQCKKSHRENKDKLMGKIYKILRRNK